MLVSFCHYSPKGVAEIEGDLQKLETWADQWQMNFNVDKCSVMHMGRGNVEHSYSLCGTRLKTSIMERDLGVLVDKTMKFSEHCDKAAKSANAALGMIKRNMVSRSSKVITRMYKALVRPKLEYCVQAWRPFLKKDINKLEKVQRRATKMIAEYRGFMYEDRLRLTGLTTLEERRNRGDMIETFKIMKGITKVDKNKFFKLNEGARTRGNDYKLSKNRCRLDLRKNFFSNRVVNRWNGLPNNVVGADSVNMFKNRYDRHMTSIRCM